MEVRRVLAVLASLLVLVSAGRDCTWTFSGGCKKLRCVQVAAGPDFNLQIQKQIFPGTPYGCFSLEIVGPTGEVIKSISVDQQHPFKELRLSNGVVKRIDSGTFTKFVNLSSLRLDNNRLESVSFDDSLKNLNELYLNDNQISKITPEDLPKSTSLRVLDVSRNKLTSLQDLTCRYGNLQDLSASGNGVNVLGSCLSSNKQLKNIDISHNNLDDVDATNSLGRLDSLESLRLDHNKLKDVPRELDLPQLRQLNLDSNKITSLDNTCLNKLPQLRQLTLDNNQINSIAPGTFQNLGLLKHISLSGNCIDKLTAGTFKGLDSVEELDLRGLGIREIENGAFDGLADLKKLDLSDNPIREIESGALASLTRLETLRLPYVTPIQAGWFDGLIKLKKVVLVRTKDTVQSTIPTNAFLGLENVEELDLTDLAIGGISAGAFSNLRKLNSLVLSNNEIRRLDSNAFDGLDGLNRLELENNKIEDIAPGAFVHLNQLNRLDLSNNNIGVIQANTLSGLFNLRYLDLRGNPIRSLKSGSFSGSPFLRILHLNTGLVSIEPRTFGSQPFVSSLRLESARLPDLHDDTFVGLSGLTSLDLHDTDIGTVWPNAFSGLSSLGRISFSGNSSIEVIKPGAFKPLVALGETGNLNNLGIKRIDGGGLEGLVAGRLNLSDNQLSVVVSDNFAGVAGITDLDLSDNQISYIAEDAFSNLTSLQTLDLSGNAIKELRPEVLEPLSGLTKIDLSGNPITCDSLTELLEGLKQRDVTSIPSTSDCNSTSSSSISSTSATEAAPSSKPSEENTSCADTTTETTFQALLDQANEIINAQRALTKPGLVRDFAQMPEIRRKLKDRLSQAGIDVKTGLKVNAAAEDGGKSSSGGLNGIQIALVALCACVVLAQLVFFARRYSKGPRRAFRFTRSDSEIELLRGHQRLTT